MAFVSGGQQWCIIQQSRTGNCNTENTGNTENFEETGQI